MSGRLGEALKIYKVILAKTPHNPRALHGMGLSLRELGNPQEAAKYLQASLQKSADPEVLRNLGVIQLELTQQEEGLASLRRASEAAPDRVDIVRELAVGLAEAKKYEEALEAADRAIAGNPEEPRAWYAKALAEAHLCAFEARQRSTDRLCALMRSQLERSGRPPNVSPMGACFLVVDNDLQKSLAQEFAKKYSQKRLLPPEPRMPRERLRIGYLSADLSDHPVGFLLRPVFQAHDRDRVETRVFALKSVTDDTQQAIASAVDRYEDVSAMGDDALAEHLRKADLDILVDLGGYTTGQRPGVLGRRPSRVQLHYLGYPGTVGRALVDAQLSHSARDPVGTEAYFDEPLVRMDAYLGTGGWTMGEKPSRAELGLPPDKLVFGFFSAPYRIDGATVSAWAEILRAVPQSVLWLNIGAGRARDNLTRTMAEAGLDPNRLVFDSVSKLSKDWRHRHMDLWLDAFTLSSGTSGALAAWAGVPVLTRSGGHPQSRTGAMIASLAGMGDMIMGDTDAYIQRAIDLARNPDALNTLKARLAARSGLLFKPEACARALEDTYRGLSERALSPA